MKFANLFGGVKREAQAAPLRVTCRKYSNHFLYRISNGHDMPYLNYRYAAKQIKVFYPLTNYTAKI